MGNLDRVQFQGFEQNIGHMGPHSGYGNRLQSMIDSVKKLGSSTLRVDKETGFSLTDIAQGIKASVKEPEDVPALLAKLKLIQSEVKDLQRTAAQVQENAHTLREKELFPKALFSLGEEYNYCDSNQASLALGELMRSIIKLSEKGDFSKILAATTRWTQELEAFQRGYLQKNENDPPYSLTQQGLEAHRISWVRSAVTSLWK